MDRDLGTLLREIAKVAVAAAVPARERRPERRLRLAHQCITPRFERRRLVRLAA